MNTKFRMIIEDLREAGYTDAELADLCGCTRQNIWLLRTGEAKRVNYDIGQKLVDLHGDLD